MDGVIETFDIEGYAGKYKGRNCIDRLLYIADNSSELRSDALRILLRQLHESYDMNFYLQVYEILQKESPQHLHMSKDDIIKHADVVKQNAAKKKERLEAQLNSYRSSMIKESIRMGHTDFGEYYYRLGDLPMALKSFAQARDYCTTDPHNIDMCLNVIRVSLHMNNFNQMINYLRKLEQVVSEKDIIVQSKIHAAFGLVALHEKKYYEAALHFVQCRADIGSSFNDVIAIEDIALYGGLCALASFSRIELREKVVNSINFRAFLELLPWVRELINDFYSSNYNLCLQTLNMHKSMLQLDIHLSPHVDAIFQDIRSWGIVQYFHPFVSVDLAQMAPKFNTDMETLEKEIRQLIINGKIQARLDSYGKTLHAHNRAKRQEACTLAIKVGRKYVAESRNLMLRMSLQKNNIVVREEK